MPPYRRSTTSERVRQPRLHFGLVLALALAARTTFVRPPPGKLAVTPPHPGAAGHSAATFSPGRRAAALLPLLGIAVWASSRNAAATEAAAAVDQPVLVYFGQGCFWHVQHELTTRSLKLYKEAPKGLYAEGAFSPAVAGYAGGRVETNDKRVCYPNWQGAPTYDRLGHTEVVGMKLPPAGLESMSRLYFDEAASGRGRHDPDDAGPAYRSAIGLPGGMDSLLFPAIERANAGRLKLLAGQGGDEDTLDRGEVYIYDSVNFPFYPGELYHQFHDDMSERYSGGYKALKDKLKRAGMISATGCPE